MTRSILVALVLMLSAPINAEYTTRVVAEDLAFPWSMVFINDDTFIVATRSGTLEQLSLSSSERKTLQGAPETYVESQGGYFDLVLDPDFASNQLVYLALGREFCHALYFREKMGFALLKWYLLGYLFYLCMYHQ